MKPIIDKNTFLEQVYTIADAIEEIIKIDDGKIVNECALKSYPFHISLDEMHSEILRWASGIEDELENDPGGKK